MKITKQSRRGAKEIFRSCLVDGRLDENRVRKAVQEIVAQKPRGYVGILTHLERLVKLEQARRTARIESAVPLGTDLEQSVRGQLERVYGPGLNFSFVQNSALIGGLRIQVGSDVYDGSVKARLAALEKSF